MRIWIAVLALAAAACQAYPFAYQRNQRVDGRNYQLEIATEGKTDILFVIDNSGSMAEEQQKLKENVGAFIEVLTRSVNDYQVGVISTDVFREPLASNCEPCCDLDTDADGLPDWSNCDGGRLVAADGRTRLFKRPYSEDPAELTRLTQELITSFNEVVTSLGTIGHATERPFEATRRALDPEGDVAVRALNRGFLRPEADLALIFLTDEDDCSFRAPWYGVFGRDDSDCYVDAADAIPVGEFVDFLQTLKGGDVRRVRAAAILGAVERLGAPLGFAASGCATEETSGAAVNQCGCWSARYLPDRRPSPVDPQQDRGGDFYCNYMSDPPFNQSVDRLPDLGNDQGGCISLPGSRYMRLLEELDARRRLVGQLDGVLVDSICRADYGVTLQEIALTVVLSNCFTLREPPADDAGSVVLTRNGEVLPRVEAGSVTPGWSYNPAINGVCLEGGVIKEVGDIFEMTVVSGTRGFDTQE